MEGHDEDRIDEVDEGIANVAVVFEVDGQIEEVISTRVKLVDLLEQHLLSVLVRYMTNHNCGPLIFTSQNSAKVNCVSVLAS